MRLHLAGVSFQKISFQGYKNGWEEGAKVEQRVKIDQLKIGDTGQETNFQQVSVLWPAIRLISHIDSLLHQASDSSLF